MDVFRVFIDLVDDPVLTPLARLRIAEIGAAEETGQPQSAPASAAPGERESEERDAALARADQIPPRFVQLALADLAFYKGRIDGLIGPASRRAIRGWQASRGFTASGRLDNRQTVDLLVQAAEAGGAESQNLVGQMRGTGIGLPQDQARSRAWFEKSAKQGNAYAAYNLGVLHRDGKGVSLFLYEMSGESRELECCAGLHFQAQCRHRRALPAADGGGVGVRLPQWRQGAALLRRL